MNPEEDVMQANQGVYPNHRLAIVRTIEFAC
jgi:hypothetical protein